MRQADEKAGPLAKISVISGSCPCSVLVATRIHALISRISTNEAGRRKAGPLAKISVISGSCPWAVLVATRIHPLISRMSTNEAERRKGRSIGED